jgi:hypothetical protein
MATKKKAATPTTPVATSLVLRTCRADMTSTNGFVWPEVGGEASCPDWSAKAECGNGLHGWLYGQGDHGCSSFLDTDSKWLVVEVATDSIVMLGGKCKFPRGTVRFAGERKAATEFLLANEPRSSSVAVIGAMLTVGDRQAVIVGALGSATAGYSGTATAGDSGTATAGDRGTATAGYSGTATAGYSGTATAGYSGTATAGDSGTATAGDRGTATAGYSGTATAGYSGTATAGDSGTATAGDSGTATAGDRGTATAGYSGTATAGDSGTATAGDSGTATAGDRGTATAGDRGTLNIRWWDSKHDRYRMVVGYVGEDGIEANVAYKLDETTRKFVKAAQ